MDMLSLNPIPRRQLGAPSTLDSCIRFRFRFRAACVVVSVEPDPYKWLLISDPLDIDVKVQLPGTIISLNFAFLVSALGNVEGAGWRLGSFGSSSKAVFPSPSACLSLLRYDRGLSPPAECVLLSFGDFVA